MRENDLIRAVKQRVQGQAGADNILGIGDDCCVWTPGGPTCLSTDTIVEGRHFLPSDDARLIGRKAAGASLSDLAAMGARPVGAVVAITCPAHRDGLTVMEGLIAELHRHGCPLLGGDTTSGDHLVITVTVWGEGIATAHGPGRLLRRDGAQAGDLLIVTGPLGGSLASGRHLRPEPRLTEGQWLASHAFVHALMDISDGLASDAPTLAEASGCGCLLLPNQIPIHDDVAQMSDQQRAACCDGEDFELLAAVAADQWPTIQLAWPFPRPLYSVGWLLAEPGAFIEDSRGHVVPMPWRGYEHA